MITDPVAVGFTTNRIRSAANHLTQTYYAMKALVNDWNSLNMGARLAPGDSTVVDDGASTASDGRYPVTADDCYALILRAQAFVTELEANNNTYLTTILKAGVNTIR